MMTQTPADERFQPETVVTRQELEHHGRLSCLFVDDLYVCAAMDAIYLLEKVDEDYYLVRHVHARGKRQEVGTLS